MAANTRTRSEDVQLWVDLDGLSLFLSNLIYEASGDNAELPLSGIVNDDLIARDRASGLSSDDLFESLWRGVDDDDPEFIRASARSGLLAARLFAFVASEDGRLACDKWADRLLQIGMGQLRKADDA